MKVQVYFKDKTLEAIEPEWLGFTAQKKAKTGVGYRIVMGDSVGVDPTIPKEFQSNYGGYGGSLKGALQTLSRKHRIHCSPSRF